MHRQIWAPPLPLGHWHASAHLSCWGGAGRTTGRCPQVDARGSMPPAHPRDHDAEVGVRTQQLHSLPQTHESSQPARSSSVAAAAGCSLPQGGTPAALGFFGPCNLFGPFWTQAGAWGSLNSRRDCLGWGVSRDALAFPSSSSSSHEKSLLPIPVPLKPHSGPGAVTIWGSPSQLCQRQRREGGSRLAPIPMPIAEGFLPAARSPATAAQPGRHGRTPAEK